MIKKIFMLLCIAMLYPYSGYSQIGNFDCLKDGPKFQKICCISIPYSKIEPEIGLLTLMYRVIGNKLEIIFDKSRITTNFWELSDDAALDYIRYSIITYSSHIKYFADGVQLTEISFPFESECVSYPGCYIKLVTGSELICNEDPAFNYKNLILESSGESYIRDVRRRVCGTKCCEMLYKVQWVKVGDTDNDYKYDIISKVIRDYPGSECQATGLKDCKTGAEVKCESDCKIK